METARTEHSSSPASVDASLRLTSPSPRGALERLILPASAPPLDISRLTLPPPVRPQSTLGVLDISEYFAETSGGVRTYLLEKAAYVEARPALRQVLVVPGAHDRIGTSSGVRCYQLHGPLIPMQRTYRFMLATRSTRRIIVHERPDVVEVGSAYFVPWVVRRATRRGDIPVVWFYHSNIPRIVARRGEHDTWYRRAAASASWWYMRQLSRLVHTTIVASDFVQRDLERAGITRVTRVPLGVDVALFNPARRAHRLSTRLRLGVPADAAMMLFVGRFSTEKNLDLVLEAWPQIRRRTDATLVLVGAGPMRARLERVGRSAGVLVCPFERDRDALANLYAAADVVVSPGPTETFGLAALEAMASGTPVLGCGTGGVAEQVERSGAGAIFPVDDATVLAETAIALLQSDLPALGARGRAYAEREHTWDRVFDRIFDVYRDVIRG